MKVQPVTTEETRELQARLDELFLDLKRLDDHQARSVLCCLFGWFQSCAEPSSAISLERNRIRAEAAYEFTHAVTASLRHT